MSANGRHRRLIFLGYVLYGLSVTALSYFVIFHRLFSPRRTMGEFFFVLPGALFIGSLFPGHHSGPGFWPAWILFNAFMYLVVPPVVVEIVRRTRGGRLGWRDLLRLLALLALWLVLTVPRGGSCVTPWETVRSLLLGDWWVFLSEFPVEGFVVVTAAWLGADRLAARLIGSREGSAPLQPGPQAGVVSLAMASALLAAWGLFGIVHCWPPAWR